MGAGEAVRSREAVKGPGLWWEIRPREGPGKRGLGGVRDPGDTRGHGNTGDRGATGHWEGRGKHG